MKLSALVFIVTGEGTGLEASQGLVNRQGQTWRVLRSADNHDDIVVMDPVQLVNSHAINSQLELACWLQDKEPI